MSESRIARGALLLLMLALVVVAHGLVVMYLQAPLIGLLAIWVLALVWLITRSKKAMPRIFAVNLIAIFIVFAGAEAFFLVKHRRTDAANFSQVSSHNYQIVHDVLGFAPYPETCRQVSKSYRGEPLYATTYTIDDVGLRISPPEHEQGVDGTVLFFGGSFTYGEGVGDVETLPYQVGLLTDGRLRVRNLGFHGYGPQQMLASLQSGLLQRQVVLREPIVAIYQFGLFHARRASGRVGWSRRLPRYQMTPGGGLTAAGFFEDDRPTDSFFTRIAARSFLLSDLFGEGRLATRTEIELLLRIVDAARDELTRVSPGTEFHVMYWDEGNWSGDRAVLKGLEELGIPTHRVSSVIPVDDPLFRLSRYDRHPNALANRKLAEYVVHEILNRKVSPGTGW